MNNLNTRSEDRVERFFHHKPEHSRRRFDKRKQRNLTNETHSKNNSKTDTTTEQDRSKDWFKNYQKEKNIDRERSKCNRLRGERRRDRNDDRNYRNRQYTNKEEKSNRGGSSFHDRSPRSSSKDGKGRKKYESRTQLLDGNDITKMNTGTSLERNEVKFEKKDSPPSPSTSKVCTFPTDNKSISTILPNYYNPNIINPTKYAEQVQKRKLLWSNKKNEDTINRWGDAKFAQDADGKVASKFMRLMGIKSVPKTHELETSVSNSNSESIRRREEMFSSMEQQYEVARQVTHTMRGVGLGFSSQSRQF